MYRRDKSKKKSNPSIQPHIHSTHPHIAQRKEKKTSAPLWRYIASHVRKPWNLLYAITEFDIKLNKQQTPIIQKLLGAAEARRAHNPEDLGSKPRAATVDCFFFAFFLPVVKKIWFGKVGGRYHFFLLPHPLQNVNMWTAHYAWTNQATAHMLLPYSALYWICDIWRLSHGMFFPQLSLQKY